MSKAAPPEIAFTVTDSPDPIAEAVIENGLTEFNKEQAGFVNARALAVLLKHPETGAVAGGLLGRTTYGLLFVDLFFLPPWARGAGAGSKILAAAEEEAVRRGCTTAVLFTIVFQAPGFYARHGYSEIGRVECAPPGHSRVCLDEGSRRWSGRQGPRLCPWTPPKPKPWKHRLAGGFGSSHLC